MIPSTVYLKETFVYSNLRSTKTLSGTERNGGVRGGPEVKEESKQILNPTALIFTGLRVQINVK